MAITITTTSSLNRAYFTDKNAIFPAFADNIPYEVWTAPTTKTAALKTYFQFLATGGSTYTWTLVNGSLPTGLTLASDGKLSGTARATGNFTFTLQCNSGADNVQKTFNMTVHPPRIKKFLDAKYCANVFVSAKQYPVKYGSTIPEFEARLTNLNVTEWINQLWNLGFRSLQSLAYSFDSVKLWPATTSTARNYKTTRDFVKEFGEAAQAKGMEYAVYIAVDYIGNDPVWQNTDPNAKSLDGTTTYTTDTTLVGKKISGKSGVNSDPPTKSQWGAVNNSLVTELVQKPYIDRLWFDVGATDKNLYQAGAVEPDFARWENLWAIIRYYNPWMAVGINPGINTGRNAAGNLYQYPHIDYTIFEGQGPNRETSMANGVMPLVNKVMGFDVENPMDYTFILSEASDAPSADHKNSDMIIRNIQKTWKRGGTYTLNWPALVDGTMIPPVYLPTLQKVADFVNANMGYSALPTITVNGNIATITTASKARIYYTLDGSEPNALSNLYVSPITLPNKPVIIKAISSQSGLPWSRVAKAEYAPVTPVAINGLKTLLPSVSGDTAIKEANSYYRGMVFSVGEAAIILSKVGRKGTATTPHNIIIKKFWNNEPVLFWTLKANDEVIGGYQYARIPETRLDPGMTYYIGIQENSTDSYFSNNFSAKPELIDLRISSAKILTSLGDVAPIVNDNLGQFINMQYRLGEKSGNIANAASVQFLHHLTNVVLNPAVSITNYYAVNVVDNEPDSTGGGNGDYLYVTELDLQKSRRISQVTVWFPEKRYPLEIELHVSNRRTGFGFVQSRKQNDSGKLTFIFPARYARYVYLRIVSPTDGTTRVEGTQISNIEIT